MTSPDLLVLSQYLLRYALVTAKRYRIYRTTSIIFDGEKPEMQQCCTHFCKLVYTTAFDRIYLRTQAAPRYPFCFWLSLREGRGHPARH